MRSCSRILLKLFTQGVYNRALFLLTSGKGSLRENHTLKHLSVECGVHKSKISSSFYKYTVIKWAAQYLTQQRKQPSEGCCVGWDRNRQMIAQDWSQRQIFTSSHQEWDTRVSLYLPLPNGPKAAHTLTSYSEFLIYTQTSTSGWPCCRENIDNFWRRMQSYWLLPVSGS